MRICFFGDSFVNGTGDDDGLGWPGRLCAEARHRGRDITGYNLGIRRDTSADIAARWNHEAAARLPAGHDGRLVFSFGVNDCVHEPANQPRISADRTIEYARSILGQARAGWPTLMVGPPATGNAALDHRVEALSGRLASLCGDLDVPYLPIFETTAQSEAWRREAAQGDGTHPNREGYALIAGAVLAWQPWRDWVG